MIVTNTPAAKKARQVVNSLLQLHKNTSNISQIIDDLHQAYTIEELVAMKHTLDVFIEQNNANEKSKITSSSGALEDTAEAL